MKHPVPFSDRRGFLAASLAALGLAGACAGEGGNRRTDRAPIFRLPTVRGTRFQGTFDLGEHLGQRPVLLSFFATWCRPCEVELPFLQQMHTKHHKQGLVIAAISVDGPESTALIAPMALRLGLDFPVLHDADSRISARYNPRLFVPLLVAIDRQGKIVKRREGWNATHKNSLPDEVAALLRA